MCGIGGCVAASAAPDREALRRLGAAIAHRGPDDAGMELEGRVGLVHARLAIVEPTPAGRQPMRDDDARWLLAYNGEIFNHHDLRRRLPDAPYRGDSDTETLLHALAAWGERAIGLCNGLFAYAALDRERRRLLLVRDRFGVKPLYWGRHAGCLWFASELRALLAAGMPRRARPDLLRHAVTLGWLNGEATALENVAQVLPGHLLEIDIDTLAVAARRWYDPADAVDPERAAALASSPRMSLVGELESALRTSVRRRLMADVPLGTMCSGGLDSSLVTALAREQHPAIHAYNASVVDQPQVDEGPWAERVAAALGVELHTVPMTDASWRAGLVEATCHNEHPLVHESSVPMAQIAAAARADGVKVLLSGEGADELFGGYEWLHLEQYADFGARERHIETVTRATYRWLQRRLSGARDGANGADTREREHEQRLARSALAAYAHHRGARGRLEAALLLDLQTYLPHLLNRQDKNTMQRSIETRVPFLDTDLVALALNLPLELRVEPQRKQVLRELAAKHLPQAVVERPKIGFGFDIDRLLEPVHPRFLADGQLREVLRLSVPEWTERRARLTGQGLLLHVTGEIWCRSLLSGQTGNAIAAELWRDAPESGGAVRVE